MVKAHLSSACEIVSEHHADEKYMVVSAASIVAKVVRDREIIKLAKKYGEIGSGYPSDPVTIRWLSQYLDDYTSPPPIARKSWKTVSRPCSKKIAEHTAGFLKTIRFGEKRPAVCR